MVKTMPRLDEAKEKLLQAFADAYGRTQTTPDGLLCRMGRIARAYRLMAQASDGTKHQVVIKKMQEEATHAYALEDRLRAAYVRLCKIEDVSADLDIVGCDCPHCRQRPMFGGEA